jgi:hypothetical protein
MSLIGGAKDSLLALPSGTIETWDELKEKFLKRFFHVTKFMVKRAEITDFE